MNPRKHPALFNYKTSNKCCFHKESFNRMFVAGKFPIIRTVITFIFLLPLNLSFGQIKTPDEVYLNYTYQGTYGEYLTQILKFYNDSSFSIYTNNDQGDYLDENLLAGTYSIRNGERRLFLQKEVRVGWDTVYIENWQFSFRDSVLTALNGRHDWYPYQPDIVFQRIDFHTLLSLRIITEESGFNVLTRTTYHMFEDHNIFNTRTDDSCFIKQNEQSWIYLDSTRFREFAALLSGYDFFQPPSYGGNFHYVEIECRLPGARFKFLSYHRPLSLLHFFKL